MPRCDNLVRLIGLMEKVVEYIEKFKNENAELSCLKKFNTPSLWKLIRILIRSY